MGTMPRADLRREGLDVDHDEVDAARCRCGEALQVGWHVASRQDPRVDLRVERSHLATDERLGRGQIADGTCLDPVGRERVASPVGRVQLDAEIAQVAREVGDPVTVRRPRAGLARRGPPSLGCERRQAPGRGARQPVASIASVRRVTARPSVAPPAKFDWVGSPGIAGQVRPLTPVTLRWRSVRERQQRQADRPSRRHVPTRFGGPTGRRPDRRRMRATRALRFPSKVSLGGHSVERSSMRRPTGAVGSPHIRPPTLGRRWD